MVIIYGIVIQQQSKICKIFFEILTKTKNVLYIKKTTDTNIFPKFKEIFMTLVFFSAMIWKASPSLFTVHSLFSHSGKHSGFD